MSRFATDLLTYLRDLLVVKAGGDNQRQSALFDTNLSLPMERIFQMIAVVTNHLPEIKKGTHPRIYAEMMTIQLAKEEGVALPSGLSSDVTTEIEDLNVNLISLSKPWHNCKPVPHMLLQNQHRLNRN